MWQLIILAGSVIGFLLLMLGVEAAAVFAKVCFVLVKEIEAIIWSDES